MRFRLRQIGCMFQCYLVVVGKQGWVDTQPVSEYRTLCRYNPTDVGRAAKLLQAGGVVGKSLQPYEAHVPFLLQLKIDLNLAGMGWLHLSQVPCRFHTHTVVHHASIQPSQKQGAERNMASIINWCCRTIYQSASPQSID